MLLKPKTSHTTFFQLKAGPLNNSGFGTDTAIGSLARVGPVTRLVEGIGHSHGRVGWTDVLPIADNGFGSMAASNNDGDQPIANGCFLAVGTSPIWDRLVVCSWL